MKSAKYTIGGREAIVTELGRVRPKGPNRSYFNLLSVRFTDNGEYHSMGAAQYVKWVNAIERSFSKGQPQ